MLVSRKTRYALRATFELARRFGTGPVKIARIAKAQAIPPRFLETILNHLKRGGLVASRRGKQGGYLLVQPPETITVGAVVRCMQGPVRTVDCGRDDPAETCPLFDECVFVPLWERVRKAIVDIYDHTTFQDLVDRDRRAPDYSI